MVNIDGKEIKLEDLPTICDNCVYTCATLRFCHWTPKVKK